tara:strand:+ start:100 stop:1776 length:1677 start_codon:yes stop_codon:yes gene_type:complete
MNETLPSSKRNFIQHIIDKDVKSFENQTSIMTRFPPEPNGHLHIGHAKSMCLNFGLAKEYGGICNLRFDDTNPTTENKEYVDSIKDDVEWLGFNTSNKTYYASDYFSILFDFAINLIKKGKAFVDSQPPETIRSQRGSLQTPGTNSPFRDRDVNTNLDLFHRMRQGEFDEGEHILRAKIDMSSPNMNMRDPTLYRIRKMDHYRTGNQWNIYPMYDFTQCLSDAIEGVTHSICTLEFEDHRPLYDWVIENVETSNRPKQIEFARLEIDYSITSKRKLLSLVEEGNVSGWDDPRLQTLKGMRRRGYPPEAIKNFCELIGITKKQAVIDLSTLENCVREELDKKAPRIMAVLDPLKVIIKNFPGNTSEQLNAPNHPKDSTFGERKLPITKEIYIERSDFMEEPPKKFHRLSPGKKVRLRYAFVIRCEEIVKDENGTVQELHCSYDSSTYNGKNPEDGKVKGIIHWVSAEKNIPIQARLFDRLFTVPNPNGEEDFRKFLNPKSLEIKNHGLAEISLKSSKHSQFQFERTGYFSLDKKESTNDKLVYNRTTTLRDSWLKEQKK